MSVEREPPRWRDEGSDAPPELRELLRGGRAELAGAGEVAQLARSLAGALGPEAGLGAASATLPAGKAALFGWRWAAWLAAGAGALVVIGYLAAGTLAARVDVLAPAPTRAPEPPLPAAPEPLSAASREPPPALSEPAPAPLPPRSAAAAPASSETQLLERARAVLASRPSRALALASEHQRRFPQGVLAEEREAIAIEALRRLGRERAAQRRAAAFEARYPDSVHQNRVRASSGPTRH